MFFAVLYNHARVLSGGSASPAKATNDCCTTSSGSDTDPTHATSGPQWESRSLESSSGDIDTDFVHRYDGVICLESVSKLVAGASRPRSIHYILGRDAPATLVDIATEKLFQEKCKS